MNANDVVWMSQALLLAQKAEGLGEVPVGAVLVKENQLLAEAWNQPIAACDPCAHAEMIVLQRGAKKINNYRLLNTTLYVTLEPCMMCVGAMIHARIEKLVFGSFDGKTGAVSSQLTLLDSAFINHKIIWQGGVLEKDCQKILQDFFKKRRYGA